MSDEKNSIEQTVQVYFDSMYESDSAKVDQAFHPNAMITGATIFSPKATTEGA